jgi:hypothetical protein
MRATEDGDCSYLYMKDKTWTVVGLAEDEAVPGKAMTVSEVNKNTTSVIATNIRKRRDNRRRSSKA